MSDFGGHRPGSRDYRRLIVGLFFAGIATFALLYTTQSVLPLIADAFRVTPATAALTVSACTVGLAVTVIPGSVVADRFGRVRAMTIGIIAASLLGIAAPFSADIVTLLALRFAEGVALGAIPAVALAYLSEEVNAAHAAAAAGSYIAGTTVGGMTGRVVSGAVGDLVQWQTGMWAVALVCAAAAVIFLWLIPAAEGFTPAGRGGSGPGGGIAARLALNLRTPAQLALYAQAFLLMGAFVAAYNYLAFHLIAPPFSLPTWMATLLFFAFLAGTISSPWAGTLAARHGRLPVLLWSTAVMAAGAAIMLIPHTALILVGLAAFTGGFFAAHGIASGWAPVAARPGTRAQASALYYLGYYTGSSLFGWLLGYLYAGPGWAWLIAAVLVMCAAAAVVAAAVLRRADSRAET